jgi:hypothetical protein
MADANADVGLFPGAAGEAAAARGSSAEAVSQKQVFRAWDVEQGDLLPAAAVDLVRRPERPQTARRTWKRIGTSESRH